MTVNHDAVGSSPTGGAIQALLRQCFFVARNAECQVAKLVAKPEKRRRWRKKRTGFGAAVVFLREYEQKKTGTARGSVTRLTMPLVQAGQGEPFKHCSGGAFFVARNDECQVAKSVMRLRQKKGKGFKLIWLLQKRQ